MAGRKISVSVGVSAYNEEKNIAQFLRSLLGQKAENYKLIEILIVSDGSTDNTCEIVKKFHSKIITLIEGKKRLGKAARMGEILEKSRGDFIVLLDADILLASASTLENLVKVFLKEKNVGLVGGCTNPRVVNTFTSKAVAATSRAYDEIRKNIHNGSNVFACSGHILGLSKDFARSVRVPENIYANDAFLYFSCLEKGYSFRFAPEARVWHHSPDNLKDQVTQNSRFVSSPYKLAKIFGDVVYREYTVPRGLFLKASIKQFFRMPVHSLYIFLVNLYCKLKAKQTVKTMSGQWNISLSTKEGF